MSQVCREYVIVDRERQIEEKVVICEEVPENSCAEVPCDSIPCSEITCDEILCWEIPCGDAAEGEESLFVSSLGMPGLALFGNF